MGLPVPLLPRPAQEALLASYFGATRWVWNAVPTWRSTTYWQDGAGVTGVDFSRELTWLKMLAPYQWLNQVPATVLTQALRDPDRAFSNFFASARYGKPTASRPPAKPAPDAARSQPRGLCGSGTGPVPPAEPFTTTTSTRPST